MTRGYVWVETLAAKTSSGVMKRKATVTRTLNAREDFCAVLIIVEHSVMRVIWAFNRMMIVVTNRPGNALEVILAAGMVSADGAKAIVIVIQIARVVTTAARTTADICMGIDLRLTSLMTAVNKSEETGHDLMLNAKDWKLNANN